jgi:hypothetical protein
MMDEERELLDDLRKALKDAQNALNIMRRMSANLRERSLDWRVCMTTTEATWDVGGLLLTDAEYDALCWPPCWWQSPYKETADAEE